MSRSKENGLVPKLRFPEFQGKEPWKVLSGADGFKQISNKKHNSNLPILAITQEFGAIPREYIDYHVSVSDKSVEGYKVVEQGDFIISLRSFQGGIEYSNYLGLCSPAYVVLRITQGFNSQFYRSYFKAPSFIKALTKNIEGLRDGKMISYKQFSEVPLLTPQLNEQQKIADCLSSIDKLIIAQAEKIESLKAHKKGLMQKLFPAKGKATPELRFPEFRESGEYSSKKFGDVLEIKSGKGFKASEYSSSGVKLLQIENVGYGLVKWTGNTVHLPNYYIDEHAELVLKEGDVVIALNRPITNGELKIARLKSSDKSILYQRVGKIGSISDNITNSFVFHLCQWFIHDFVVKQSIGSDQPFISLKTLYSQDLCFPDPEEQERISECLSAIDHIISGNISKLNFLNNHKKGLMQQLFPNMDEVKK